LKQKDGTTITPVNLGSSVFEKQSDWDMADGGSARVAHAVALTTSGWRSGSRLPGTDAGVKHGLRLHGRADGGAEPIMGGRANVRVHVA
jgi:hypothetical protein